MAGERRQRRRRVSGLPSPADLRRRRGAEERVVHDRSRRDQPTAPGRFSFSAGERRQGDRPQAPLHAGAALFAAHRKRPRFRSRPRRRSESAYLRLSGRAALGRGRLRRRRERRPLRAVAARAFRRAERRARRLARLGRQDRRAWKRALRALSGARARPLPAGQGLRLEKFPFALRCREGVRRAAIGAQKRRGARREARRGQGGDRGRGESDPRRGESGQGQDSLSRPGPGPPAALALGRARAPVPGAGGARRGEQGHPSARLGRRDLLPAFPGPRRDGGLRADRRLFLLDGFLSRRARAPHLALAGAPPRRAGPRSLFLVVGGRGLRRRLSLPEPRRTDSRRRAGDLDFAGAGRGRIRRSQHQRGAVLDPEARVRPHRRKGLERLRAARAPRGSAGGERARRRGRG